MAGLVHPPTSAAVRSALKQLHTHLRCCADDMHAGVRRAAEGLLRHGAAATAEGASTLLSDWCELRDRVNDAHFEARRLAGAVKRLNDAVAQAFGDNLQCLQVRRACARYDACTRQWRTFLDSTEDYLIDVVLKACAGACGIRTPLLKLPTPPQCMPPDGLF